MCFSSFTIFDREKTVFIVVTMQHCWLAHFGRGRKNWRIVIVFTKRKKKKAEWFITSFSALPKQLRTLLIEKKSFFSASSFRRRFLLVTNLESINNCIMSRCPFFLLVFVIFCRYHKTFHGWENLLSSTKKQRSLQHFCCRSNNEKWTRSWTIKHVREVHVHELSCDLFAPITGGKSPQFTSPHHVHLIIEVFCLEFWFRRFTFSLRSVNHWTNIMCRYVNDRFITHIWRRFSVAQ